MCLITHLKAPVQSVAGFAAYMRPQNTTILVSRDCRDSQICEGRPSVEEQSHSWQLASAALVARGFVLSFLTW